MAVVGGWPRLRGLKVRNVPLHKTPRCGCRGMAPFEGTERVAITGTDEEPEHVVGGWPRLRGLKELHVDAVLLTNGCCRGMAPFEGTESSQCASAQDSAMWL